MFTEKRLSISILLIGILALVLAGCSGSSGGSDSNTTDNGEVVEISMWHMEEPPNRVDRFEELIQRFNDSQDDIVVSQQVLNWDEAYQQVLSAVDAGQRPDILFAIPDFTTTVMQTGVVQDVTDFVEELDAEHAFIDSAVAPYEYGDGMKAIPLFGMTYVLWYHKDIFEEAGLEPPTTWEELLAAAEQLTTDDRYGFIMPAGDNLATDQQIFNFIATAGGGSFATPDGIDFNNENIVRAFQMYKDLAEFAPNDIASYGWGETESGFATGRAAMANSYGNIIGTFSNESGKEPDTLGAVPIPQPADGSGEQSSIYYSNAAMILSEEEEKQEAAQEFIRFLLDPENYGDFLAAEPGLFTPVTEVGMESDSYWVDPLSQDYREQLEVLMEATEYGQLFGFTDGIYEGIGKISAMNILAQGVQQMIVQDMTAEEAVEWTQNEMEAAAGQ